MRRAALMLVAALLAAPAAETRELRIVHRVMPTFSGEGQDGGCVTAQFEIQPDGSVGEIAIVDAKPGTRYVGVTVAALRQWRFESFEPPALKAQQTFSFDPNLVKMPDDAVRPPYGVVTREGALVNAPCGSTAAPAAGKKP